MWRKSVTIPSQVFWVLTWLLPLFVQNWPAWQNWFVFDTWRRHFRLRVITPPVPYCAQNTQYLFTHFPHATFPMACWLTMPLCGSPATGKTPLCLLL
jgi:hypothetical protein